MITARSKLVAARTNSVVEASISHKFEAGTLGMQGRAAAVGIVVLTDPVKKVSSKLQEGDQLMGVLGASTAVEGLVSVPLGETTLGTPLQQRQLLHDAEKAVRGQLGALGADLPVEVMVVSMHRFNLSWPVFANMGLEAHAAIAHALRTTACGNGEVLPSLLVCHIALPWNMTDDYESASDGANVFFVWEAVLTRVISPIDGHTVPASALSPGDPGFLAAVVTHIEPQFYGAPLPEASNLTISVAQGTVEALVRMPSNEVSMHLDASALTATLTARGEADGEPLQPKKDPQPKQKCARLNRTVVAALQKQGFRPQRCNR